MEEIEKLKSIIIPESSVGIYPINEGLKNQFNIYRSMEEEGKNMSMPCYGIVGDFRMLNPINEFNEEDENFITNNEVSYKVIIAIPKTVYAMGEEYYIGNFESHSNGKDDNRALSLPINWIDHLPREFVVGLYAIDKKDSNKPYLIINPNYVGIMDENDKSKFYDDFIMKNKDCLLKHGIKRFNDMDISRTNFLVKVLERKDYYLNEFYNEAMRRKGKVRTLKKD